MTIDWSHFTPGAAAIGGALAFLGGPVLAPAVYLLAAGIAAFEIVERVRACRAAAA